MNLILITELNAHVYCSSTRQVSEAVEVEECLVLFLLRFAEIVDKSFLYRVVRTSHFGEVCFLMNVPFWLVCMATWVLITELNALVDCSSARQEL